MTHEEILEQQIEALEKLLQLKSELLAAQERKIEQLSVEIAQERQKTNPLGGWFYPQPGVVPAWPSPFIGPGGGGLVYDPNQITYGIGGPAGSGGTVAIGNGTGIISTLNTPATNGPATAGYAAPANSNVVSLAGK